MVEFNIAVQVIRVKHPCFDQTVKLNLVSQISFLDFFFVDLGQSSILRNLAWFKVESGLSSFLHLEVVNPQQKIQKDMNELC